MLVLLPVGTEEPLRAARITLALILVNALAFALVSPGDARELAEREAELERIAEWSLRQVRRSNPRLDERAANFETALAFLEQELIPYIDRSYATDSTRVLMGSSFGGLFSLYALFTKPGLFSAYVAGSPALPYGDRFLFQREAAFARDNRVLKTRLYLAVGSAEPLAGPTREFAAILRNRNYSGLRLETRVIEGEHHSGNKPEAFNRALRWIFQ